MRWGKPRYVRKPWFGLQSAHSRRWKADPVKDSPTTSLRGHSGTLAQASVASQTLLQQVGVGAASTRPALRSVRLTPRLAVRFRLVLAELGPVDSSPSARDP